MTAEDHRHDAESPEPLRLASADNFRDVTGPGYRTADGTPLRPGLVYRSNELQLTRADATTLAGLGIGDVVDLREDYEVGQHPDVAVPGATWTHLGVPGIPPDVVREIVDTTAAREQLVAVYRRFVTDPAALRSFGSLLRDTAHAAAPRVFHCTAGKDRTGWVSVLLLHLAGVDDATIESDYLLTNAMSAGSRGRVERLIAEGRGEEFVDVLEPTLIADVGYLRTARRAVEEHYGDLDTYLRDGLGLDEATLARLRDLLVG